MIFLFFAVLPSVSSAAIAGDFDGSGSVTLEDIAYYMAWFTEGGTTDKQLIALTASGLYKNAKGPVVRLPNLLYDNFFGDNSIGLKDIAIMMAWFTEGASLDFSVVLDQAVILYPPANNIYKLPATPIGDSTVPVTITGIQPD
ncbi:MAG: hypothetical protein EOM80_14475 [Erysipelotrichia bacterium]|nr:hypothetical protein [Erysipelotrichia bacterium]